MSDPTMEALLDPKPGDLYSEMYSFWMIVVAVRPDGEVLVGELSPPGTMPTDMRWRTFPSRVHFARTYMYETLPSSWMWLSERGVDVTGWEQEWISKTHIDETLTAGPKKGA